MPRISSAFWKPDRTGSGTRGGTPAGRHRQLDRRPDSRPPALAGPGARRHHPDAPAPRRTAGAAELAPRRSAGRGRERDLVATVGVIEAWPGAPDVIPGEVAHSLDLRHRTTSSSAGAHRSLFNCRGHRADAGPESRLDRDPRRRRGRRVTRSRRTPALERARGRRAAAPLAQRRGHDAVVISRVAPVSMLSGAVVRLSHHPTRRRPKISRPRSRSWSSSSNVWRARDRSRLEARLRRARRRGGPTSCGRAAGYRRSGRPHRGPRTRDLRRRRRVLRRRRTRRLPRHLDAHVHFNEPGRADWEGLATGSAALAAGGGTTFFDMPLNSTPPVLDRSSFDAKQALGEARSVLDFGIWAASRQAISTASGNSPPPASSA